MTAKPHGPVAVDAQDQPLVESWYWFRSAAGYLRRNLRKEERSKSSTAFLHREILGANTSAFVDHANGDVLDNRRCNLRLCGPAQNGQNRSATIGSRVPYKGVRKKGSRYQARITINGACVFLGSFVTAQDAAMAYDGAALTHFGEFARPNLAAPRYGYPLFTPSVTNG